jgi:hypothetical protein
MDLKYHSAVFIDVDGTLVNRAAQIPKSAIEAIKTAQNEGFMTILTTGRMYRSAAKEAARIGIDFAMPVIAFNGAFCAPLNNAGEVIYYEPVAGGLFKELIEVLDGFGRRDITIFCYTPFELFVDCDNGLLKEYVKRTGSDYKILESFASLDESPKILALSDFDAPWLLAPLRAAVVEKFAGRLECVNSFPNYLEITAAGVSKGPAVKKVISRYGLDFAKTYAIGDSYNDITMFHAVNKSIAMGGSDDAVKKEAVCVTRRLEEGGIEYAFKNFILR